MKPTEKSELFIIPELAHSSEKLDSVIAAMGLDWSDKRNRQIFDGIEISAVAKKMGSSRIFQLTGIKISFRHKALGCKLISRTLNCIEQSNGSTAIDLSKLQAKINDIKELYAEADLLLLVNMSREAHKQKKLKKIDGECLALGVQKFQGIGTVNISRDIEEDSVTLTFKHLTPNQAAKVIGALKK